MRPVPQEEYLYDTLNLAIKEAIIVEVTGHEVEPFTLIFLNGNNIN